MEQYPEPDLIPECRYDDPDSLCHQILEGLVKKAMADRRISDAQLQRRTHAQELMDDVLGFER